MIEVVYWSFGFWLIYIIAFCLLSLVARDGGWRDPYLGAHIFARIAAFEALYAIAPSVLLGLLGYFSSMVSGGNFARCVKAGVQGIFILCISVWIGFCCMAWGHYFYAGRFPGKDSIFFYSASPWHLIEHAFHFSLVGASVLIAVGIIFTAIAALVLPRLFVRCEIKAKLVVCVTVVISALFAWVYLSPLSLFRIKDLNEGRLRLGGASEYRVTTVGDYLDSVLHTRSGPLMALVVPTLHQAALFESDAPFEEFVETVEYLSLDDYARQASVGGSSGSKMDVIVVLVESLRRDQLSALGGEREVMPNLEDLAEQGWLFSRHYSSSSHSNYADISVLSGTYPLWGPNIHVYPSYTSYPRPRIYDVLGSVGYKTAIISSQNERWGGMLNYLQSHHLNFLFHAGDRGEGENILGRSIRMRGGKCEDADTLAVAANWMLRQESPAFIYLNLQSSHYPYFYPDEGRRPFGKEMDVSHLNFLRLPPDEIPAIRDRYADSLNYIDTLFGGFIEKLKAAGRWENTLLIVTGDTGQAFGEHGFSGHASFLYDEVVRTPLLIYSSKLKKRRTDDLSHHADIAPTILDLLELPQYPGFQGLSLAGNDVRLWAPLVCQSPALRQVGIVTDTHKLLYRMDTSSYELYDLVDDPNERSNQHGLAEKGELETSLKRILHEWGDAQITYYGNQNMHEKYFAPNFRTGVVSGAPSP